MKIEHVAEKLLKKQPCTGKELTELFKDRELLRNIPHLGEGNMQGSYVFHVDKNYYIIPYSDITKNEKENIILTYIKKLNGNDMEKIENAIKHTQKKILFIDNLLNGHFTHRENYMTLPQFFGFLKRKKVKYKQSLEVPSPFYQTEEIRYSENSLGNIYILLKESNVVIPFEEIDITKGFEKLEIEQKSQLKEHHYKDLYYAKKCYEENIIFLEKMKKNIRLKSFF